MKKSLFIIITILCQSAFGQSDSTEFEIYHWLGKNADAHIFLYEVELNIPQNYKQDHWYYGEGIVSTLLFSDSCLVTLHCGFTMKLPLLDEPDYIVNFKSEVEDFVLFKGINKKSNLFWEEHNYKGKPINIAFSNVPKEKMVIYENILKSIKISKK